MQRAMRIVAPARSELAPEAALFALAIACLLYPVIRNSVPPLLDYAGNIARVYVLYDLIHGTGFGDMYRYRMAVVPNLAVDGIVLGLMELGLSVEIAGRCFLALTVVALATGVVALHHATFRRFSVWPVVFLPFIYNGNFFLGFINYLFGLGLVFWSAALWRLTERRSLGVAGATLLLCSLTLFFCHLLTVLLLLGLVIGMELGGLLWPSRTRRERAGRLLVAIVAGGLPLGLLLFAPLVADNAPPTLADLLEQLSVAAVRQRLSNLLSVAWGYDHTIDQLSILCELAIAAYGVWARIVRVDARLMLPTGGLLVIYLVVPDGWFGTASLPERLPMAIAMMAISATDLHPVRRWQRVALPVVIAVLVLVRGAVVERAWKSADAAFAPILAAFENVPEGSRIYTAIAYKGDFGSMVRLPYYELPAYAAIYRHAYYPHTFASFSQNLVYRQPVYAAAPDMPRNYRIDRAKYVPPDDPFAPALLAFFDYALVINPKYWPARPPANLLPVVTGPDYTLFRINRN
jgi:hypothetical protein